MKHTGRRILTLIMAILMLAGTIPAANAASCGTPKIITYFGNYGGNCPNSGFGGCLNNGSDCNPYCSPNGDTDCSPNCSLSGCDSLRDLLGRYGYDLDSMLGCRGGNCAPEADQQPTEPAATPAEPAEPVTEPTEKATVPAAPAPTQATTQPATQKPTQPAAKPTEAQAPTTPTENSSVSAYEREVVRLVNEIRTQYNIPTLTLDEELSRVARIKSADMREKGYFSHTSPTYGSPFDMMKQFGINYRTAGENIAMGYRTPQAVVDGWMNSQGHRENILRASFTRIGVGYVADGNYWTQMFIG